MTTVYDSALKLKETVEAYGLSLMLNQPVPFCRQLIRDQSARNVELARYAKEVDIEKQIAQMESRGVEH